MTEETLMRPEPPPAAPAPDGVGGGRAADKVRRGYMAGAMAAMLLVAGFCVGVVAGRSKLPEPTTGPACAGQIVDRESVPPYALKDVDFSDFWKIWEAVRQRHVDKDRLTDVQMFYGAVKGMVASMDDPYSVFFDPRDAQEFADELAGTFEGIGAEIGIKQDQLTVIAPLPGTPAARAGIKARDRILSIDDVDTVGMSAEEAVSRIRGPKGTKVELLIGRDGWTEPKPMEITRSVIVVQSVKWQMEKAGGKRLAVVTISQFNGETVAEFNEAVRSLLLEDPDGLILDLRNNPGGYLEAAVEVAGAWVRDDVVVVEKFSDGTKQEYRADGNVRLADLPTVVLVNGGSASASEIVAGALQDHGLARIIGEKTFGKGSVQEYDEYGDGSALKLTVALWFTPKDRSIDKDGIAPDEEVKMTDEDFNQDKDPQKDRARAVLESLGAGR